MTNIAEILKNAPEGLKLYSLIHGEVEFDYANDYSEYPISVQHRNGTEYFDEYGKYFDQYGECVLFPSKESQTWDNWQEVLIPKCVGSVIVSSDCTSICDYEWIVTSNGMFAMNMLENDEKYQYPFKDMTYDCLRFATPKETEAFFERLDELGYKFENGEVVVKDLKNMGCESWCKYDAKDGDFIRTYDLDTIIFSRISNGGAECYVSYNKKEDRLTIPKRGTFYFDIDSIYRPATQEEKDELLKKLDEEGYVWNQEELRLERKEKEWTIFDVKDGDFIYDKEDNNIFIFKKFLGDKICRHITYMIGEDLLITSKDDPYGFYHYVSKGTEQYRLATLEEIGILFKKLNKLGYCWDGKNNKIKRIKNNKFAINDFKPFDKVIGRMTYALDGEWCIGLYSHYNEKYKAFITTSGMYNQCVPYNKETVHLLGTTENYEGPYKTWED